MQLHVLRIKPDLQKPVFSYEMKTTALRADANVLAGGSAWWSGLPCLDTAELLRESVLKNCKIILNQTTPNTNREREYKEHVKQQYKDHGQGRWRWRHFIALEQTPTLQQVEEPIPEQTSTPKGAEPTHQSRKNCEEEGTAERNHGIPTVTPQHVVPPTGDGFHDLLQCGSFSQASALQEFLQCGSFPQGTIS